MISAAHFVRGKEDHRRELRQGASRVDGDDPQAMARFLKESGRLEDAEGLYGSKAYRELIERRIQGATDADLADLVDDLTGEVDANEMTRLSGAVALSDQVENRMSAEGPPREHGMGEDDSESSETHSRRSAPDVGWG
jgi:hypothetical protein